MISQYYAFNWQSTIAMQVIFGRQLSLSNVLLLQGFYLAVFALYFLMLQKFSCLIYHKYIKQIIKYCPWVPDIFEEPLVKRSNLWLCWLSLILIRSFTFKLLFLRWHWLLWEVQPVDLADITVRCRGHGRRGSQVAGPLRLRRYRPGNNFNFFFCRNCV